MLIWKRVAVRRNEGLTVVNTNVDRLQQRLLATHLIANKRHVPLVGDIRVRCHGDPGIVHFMARDEDIVHISKELELVANVVG